MEKTIYEIKNIKLNGLKNECSLDEWYNSMILKKASELNILDISRMLRQDIYADIALPQILKVLYVDPLEGEMYEGQLLELMINYIKSHSEFKDEINYYQLKQTINKEIANIEWDFEEDKKTYCDLVEELDRLFIN